MSGRKNTPRRASVLALLRERGPMTSQAMADHLDWPVLVVTYTIATARRTRPADMFRIVRYLPRVGEWGADMAVFSADGGEDVAWKPANLKIRHRDARKRHRDKYGEIYRAKDRVRKTGSDAAGPSSNPWLQLAPKSVRSRMGQIAANTTIREAA